MHNSAGKYNIKIGLEIHAQLNTGTKLFSSERIDYHAPPNTTLSEYTLGYPGTLPLLNQKAVDLAIQTGLAFNAKINLCSEFVRKSYFYPDMPKGYQITQQEQPLCSGGKVTYLNKIGKISHVNLQQIHLEEDSGKIINKGNRSYIDLNRAGIPLVEIVTTPGINTPADAKRIVAEIRKVLKYIDASEANMEKGQLRCDTNISVNKKGFPSHEKIEIKNLNSLHNIEKALNYEIKRQIDLLERGLALKNETRHYNEENGTTRCAREKQEKQGYRILKEPDLPALCISQEQISNLEQSIGVLPEDYYCLLIEKYSIPSNRVNVLTARKDLANLFVNVIEKGCDINIATNIFIGPLKKAFKTSPLQDIAKRQLEEYLPQLIGYIHAGAVEFSQFNDEILSELIFNPKFNLKTCLKENISKQINDDDLNDLILKIVQQNTDKVIAYQNGKKGLLGFFMGEIIRSTEKTINRRKLNGMLKNYLDQWHVK